MDLIERTGARLLVDQLLIQGVNQVFCVPGESYLGVLDALSDFGSAVRLTVNRHESGSVFMADAYARLTGQPGVAFVTRGPGASNAAIGIHNARQDSTPLVLFIGQVDTEHLGREAFQEIDYRQMFGGVAKAVEQVERADRIPEVVARAFQCASSGRPGPVVVALPEDVLGHGVRIADALCHQPVQAAATDTQIATLRGLLRQAQRPLLMLGGAGWTLPARDNLRRFVEANDLPVVCGFRFQDRFDNEHPNYIGDAGIGINPKLADRIRTADLVIAIGLRLGEITTAGYTLLRAPVPEQALVHVHAGLEELGRVYQAQLMINSGMPQFAARLAAMTPIESSGWGEQTRAGRAEYEQWQQRPVLYQQHEPLLDLWQVMRQLRQAMPRDAIVANGAGNFSVWLHRFFRYGSLGTQIAPTSGCMGYGVPAAIGAKIMAPERTVVCVTGDGDLMMSVQELATAAQYHAGVIFLVLNNAMYGTIRLHQERRFPGRVSGTSLVNPDFTALARSFGAMGAHVTDTAQFAPALSEALAYTRERRLPALIELACDPDLLTPEATVASLRGAGSQ
ncbi:MAG TPA: thiamine pyrophosphate-binding protein [Burkholderiaceae bacterium]|jgi:acetolactate synthase-1/2/3 large subunit|nr:thiamine pyrophosphate-binding protein [Burkholderiaceae bacterium]